MTPGPRRLGRREVSPAVADDSGGDAGAEQRRLAATVARLRLELARLRGELDDDAGPAPAAAARTVAGTAEVAAEEHDPAAEAAARAREAEHRVGLLVEELGSERRTLDRLRARLAGLEEAGGRRDALLADSEARLEVVAGLEAALREEREARMTLETLRDALEAAMEEQRRRHEREVTDVQEAAEERRAEHTLVHLRELERVRAELAAVRGECATLAERLEAEGAARSRAEARGRELDREVDELRNWISAVQSRRRGLLRRMPPAPPPGRFPPAPGG
jgi:chromosome segregation ATPase